VAVHNVKVHAMCMQHQFLNLFLTLPHLGRETSAPVATMANVNRLRCGGGGGEELMDAIYFIIFVFFTYC